MNPYIPNIGADQVIPFAILILAGLVVLVVDALVSRESRDRLLLGISVGALLISGWTFLLNMLPLGGPFLEGMLRADEFGKLGAITILFSALVFILLSPRFVKARRIGSGELYSLTLFATAGMVLLAVANELLTAFISLEIASLALYALVGIDRRSPRATEASFKYFILGAFASAFFVFGTAFFYGATGTTQLHGSWDSDSRFTPGIMDIVKPAKTPAEQADVARHGWGDGMRLTRSIKVETDPATNRVIQRIVSTPEPVNPVFVFLGFSMLFVGLCFKLSLAPFHMWAPDVYEGAPTLSTMFVATASKVAAFALLVHVVEALSPWPAFQASAGFAISLVAVLSMIWGNMAALVQTGIKRMLAYSSIAHGGYMAVAVAVLVSPRVLASPWMAADIRDAIILYLFSYTLMSVVAFGIAATLEKLGPGEAGNDRISAYRGLSQRHPFAAAGMAVALLSLTGIPPTVGFIGKFFIFKEAISAGMVGISVVAMLTSAVSAFYYLRVIVAMYMQEPEGGEITGDGVLVLTGGQTFALGLSTAFIFLFGMLPMLFPFLSGFGR